MIQRLPVDVPESNPPAALAAAVWRRSFTRAWLAVYGLSFGLAILGLALLWHEPTFYGSCLERLSSEEKSLRSKQFLNRGTRLISDIQNSSVWMAEFEQDQINAWLAEDFQSNHAEHSLPAGVKDPRVAIEGDLLRLGFRYSWGPISTVVQIGFKAWVPKRNLLAVELQGAWAGGLPLPTSHTRHVIEQFAYANNMNVSWKRNKGKLVALLEFPRTQREIVLQRVEIRPNIIHIKGGNGRHLPTADYSPSAN